MLVFVEGGVGFFFLIIVVIIRGLEVGKALSAPSRDDPYEGEDKADEYISPGENNENNGEVVQKAVEENGSDEGSKEDEIEGADLKMG